MAVFLTLLALVVIAATVLTYVGIDTVRSSRAGQVVSTVTDPAAPGFEALLEPTPTLAASSTSRTATAFDGRAGTGLRRRRRLRARGLAACMGQRDGRPRLRGHVGLQRRSRGGAAVTPTSARLRRRRRRDRRRRSVGGAGRARRADPDRQPIGLGPFPAGPIAALGGSGRRLPLGQRRGGPARSRGAAARVLRGVARRAGGVRRGIGGGRGRGGLSRFVRGFAAGPVRVDTVPTPRRSSTGRPARTSTAPPWSRCARPGALPGRGGAGWPGAGATPRRHRRPRARPTGGPPRHPGRRRDRGGGQRRRLRLPGDRDPLPQPRRQGGCGRPPGEPGDGASGR